MNEDVLLKLSQDLTLAGKAKKTQQGYQHAVKQLLAFCNRPAEELTDDDIRAYFLQLVTERQVAETTLRIHKAGVKFFCLHVLRKIMPTLDVVAVKRKKALPVVLSADEIAQLLAAVRKPEIKTLLTVIYACGLRLSEGRHLKAEDIDSAMMTVWVRNSKGAKDRGVPLPCKTLMLLREDFRRRRPKGPLLLGQRGAPDKPLNATQVQRPLAAALRDARIDKPATPHSLRHSYATHLLSAGVSLPVLKAVLGHTKLQTTMRYLHLTQVDETRLVSAVNTLMDDLNLDDSES